VPRETFVALEEFFGDKNLAEQYTRALEVGIRAVENISREMIEDKLDQQKILLKEELTKELVTRDLFELRMDEMLRIIEATEARLIEKIETGDARLHEKIEATEAKLIEKIEAGDARLHEKIEATEAKLIEKIETGDARLHKDMKAMEESIRKDMKIMEESIRKDMKAMFDHLNFKFNVLIGLVIIALTLANPAFNKLLEKLFF
jgi:hypothetical protein